MVDYGGLRQRQKSGRYAGITAKSLGSLPVVPLSMENPIELT